MAKLYRLNNRVKPTDDLLRLAELRRVSREAVEEAFRRGLLSFGRHRNHACWRYGDARNWTWRRMDGQAFPHGGKADAGTHGEAWHWPIGLLDVVEHNRRDVLICEGAPDGLPAFHFADKEGTLGTIGVTVMLGSKVKLSVEACEMLRGRRVRIIPDTEDEGWQAGQRWAESLATYASDVQILDLRKLDCGNGAVVKDLNDLAAVGLDFERYERYGVSRITDLDSNGPRVKRPERAPFFSEIQTAPLDALLAHEAHEAQEGGRGEKEKNIQDLKEVAQALKCTALNQARVQQWKLARKVIAHKLDTSAKLLIFDVWHAASLPFLDPAKDREEYLDRFLIAIDKVRVPAGASETLAKASERARLLPLPDIPGFPDAEISRRQLAALNRELQRAAGVAPYILGERDAARFLGFIQSDGLPDHKKAGRRQAALWALKVVQRVKAGEQKPKGDAALWRYLLSIAPEN